MHLDPIGTFQCAEAYPYDAARQGSVSLENTGTIELITGQNFEQALQDLEGFSHIWLIYHFNQNPNWKPMVHPPRANRKVGVLATRAPYRPNPIGLSCVRLESIEGLRIKVSAHDLLNDTPILDIKPYIPYADSFPEATQGWLDTLVEQEWTLNFSDTLQGQLKWLRERGVDCLDSFLHDQLGVEPTNDNKKRVVPLFEGMWEIAYRTWRIAFTPDTESHSIKIHGLYSGYGLGDLAVPEDPYQDKPLHLDFMDAYPDAEF
jgi:tRNA (adenine37-N6)-methyltransferase